MLQTSPGIFIAEDHGLWSDLLDNDNLPDPSTRSPDRWVNSYDLASIFNCCNFKLRRLSKTRRCLNSTNRALMFDVACEKWPLSAKRYCLRSLTSGVDTIAQSKTTLSRYGRNQLRPWTIGLASV